MGRFVVSNKTAPGRPRPQYVALKYTGNQARTELTTDEGEAYVFASEARAREVAKFINEGAKIPKGSHDRFAAYHTTNVFRDPKALAYERAMRDGRGRRENPGRASYSAAALSRYKQFHGHDVRNVHQLRIKSTRELVCLGDAVEIVYRSDKLNGGGDGKLAEYQHKFARGTKLYCTPDGRNVLYIHGNKLRVRAPGIIN